jgi:hypothetical protein
MAPTPPPLTYRAVSPRLLLLTYFASRTPPRTAGRTGHTHHTLHTPRSSCTTTTHHDRAHAHRHTRTARTRTHSLSCTHAYTLCHTKQNKTPTQHRPSAFSCKCAPASRATWCTGGAWHGSCGCPAHSTASCTSFLCPYSLLASELVMIDYLRIPLLDS